MSLSSMRRRPTVVKKFAPDNGSQDAETKPVAPSKAESAVDSSKRARDPANDLTSDSRSEKRSKKPDSTDERKERERSRSRDRDRRDRSRERGRDRRSRSRSKDRGRPRDRSGRSRSRSRSRSRERSSRGDRSDRERPSGSRRTNDVWPRGMMFDGPAPVPGATAGRPLGPTPLPGATAGRPISALAKSDGPPSKKSGGASWLVQMARKQVQSNKGLQAQMQKASSSSNNGPAEEGEIQQSTPPGDANDRTPTGADALGTPPGPSGSATPPPASSAPLTAKDSEAKERARAALRSSVAELAEAFGRREPSNDTLPPRDTSSIAPSASQTPSPTDDDMAPIGPPKPPRDVEEALPQDLEPEPEPEPEEEEFSGQLDYAAVDVPPCRSVFEYKKLNDISEGTFGSVSRAEDSVTKKKYALKKIKMEHAMIGFPLSSLREINVLLALKHPNLVGLREIVTDPKDVRQVYMVMEYADHDLRMLLVQQKNRTQSFRQSHVKCLMIQLLQAVAHMHKHFIMHRDLKTSNLLLMNGTGLLKVCDFGLARKFGDPNAQYTPSNLIVTLAYRAPELLLGIKDYGPELDMWSVGCIMGELLTGEPMFRANTEVATMQLIMQTIGSPNEDIWPGYSELPNAKSFAGGRRYQNKLRDKFPLQSFAGNAYLSDHGFDLISRLLCYDPTQRITAEEALQHPWFAESPLPTHPSMMPSWPSANESKQAREKELASPTDDFRLARGHMFEALYKD